MPLTVLAVLWLPVLVIPLVVRITPGLAGALDTIDYLVWAVFTVEYLVTLYLVPARWWFVRQHLIDLLVIAVPVLRPLRLLRLLRLARAGLILATGLKRARARLTHNGLTTVGYGDTYPVTAGGRGGRADADRHRPGRRASRHRGQLFRRPATHSAVSTARSRRQPHATRALVSPSAPPVTRPGNSRAG